MARSISTKPPQVTSKTSNPYNQPCFATFSMEYSSHGGGWMLYDHNLDLLGHYTGDGNQAYNQFRTYTSYAPEFPQTYGSSAYVETTSYPSSSDNYSPNVSNVGYLGHQTMHAVTERGKAAGYYTGWPAAHQYRTYAYRDLCTLAAETKQDYAIFMEKDSTKCKLYFGPRSSARYYGQRQTKDNMIEVSSKASGTTDYMMYGSGGYNPRTSQFVIMESDSSARLVPVVYSGVPNLRKICNEESIWKDKTESYSAYNSGARGDESSVHQFFENSANYQVGTRSTYELRNSGQFPQSTTIGEEARYRCIPVMCDNGKVVVFSMLPHHGAVVQRWNADGSYDSMLKDWSQSSWHSYGYEQGDRHGARWQMSSDGEYVWAYCCSYYYGSGIYWMGVRVKDGKMIWSENRDSSHGFQMCPKGKDNMMSFFSANADSNYGIRFCTHELSWEFERVADSAEMPGFSSHSVYLLDRGGNSTSYPSIVPSIYDSSLFTTDLESNA